MILTTAQVVGFARQVGFSGPNLPIAVAIAHAESGFNSAAIGDVNLTEPGEKSVGLWQINYRPSRDAGVDYRNPSLTPEPLFNARSAYIISSNGTRFTPWSTFTSGAYLQYMQDAIDAINSLNGGKMPTLSFYPMPDGRGYYIFASDGAVYAFGSAQYEGGLKWNGTAWVAR